MQGVAISRERRTRDYFNNALAELIEKVTLPNGEYTVDSLILCIAEFDGAVDYAFNMGDIELPYRKRLIDSTNDLYLQVRKMEGNDE